MRAPAAICARLEEAVSARIDGEDLGLDPEVLDAHLARCERCRSYEAAARAQHRRLRVRRATGVPDLSAPILGAVPDGPSPRPRVTVGNRALSGPQLGAAALVVAIVVVAGYVVGMGLGGGSSRSPAAYPGATVVTASQVVGKPDITLTDTDGQPYDLATATARRVTLVYFGYTHCPDICPVNVALAAEAVHGLPAAERTKVTVVFVTTDPTRDTPPVIKSWLAKFTGAFPGDPTFVGLTAPQTKIQEAEHQLHMLLSFAPQMNNPAGSYNVAHAGYTLIYSPDGFAHLQVTDQEPPTEYTTTLLHLIQKGYVAS